jgi:multicomponent Na+:H+ antiporter subunit F
MTLHGFAASFLSFATSLSLALLALALVLTAVRIIRGPTLPDRVLGLDLMTSIAAGVIAVVGINSGFTLYVDIAIALGLVGFLATVALARFINAQARTHSLRGGEGAQGRARDGTPESEATP